MDSTNFEDFNSPAGGVELSDTLSDWRKKTNGIIEKIDSLETKVETSDVTNNSLVLGKIAQVGDNKLLGNVSGGTANVSQIEIDVTASGLQNSDDTIPSSKAVKDYVDSLKFSKTYRLISATAIADANGFVTSGSSLSNDTGLEAAGIFDSSSTTAPSSLAWTNILPIVFASNVEKTIIRARYNWDGSSGDQEEMTHMTIVIDWGNSKIYGSAITNFQDEVSIYLPRTTISSASTDYSFLNYVVTAFSPKLRIGITGSSKTITKFPFLKLSSNTPDEAHYEIENHIRG